MKALEPSKIGSTLFNKDVPLCSLERLSKEEQVNGFSYLARQVIKGSKPNLKPCDEIPERVFVYTKSHIKKSLKMTSSDDRTVGSLLSVFNFMGNEELTLFLTGIYYRTIKILTEKHNVNPLSISTIILQSDSVIKVNFANNIKPTITINLLQTDPAELKNLLKKSYQHLSEFDAKDTNNRTCSKCLDKCTMYNTRVNLVGVSKKTDHLTVEKPAVKEIQKVVPKEIPKPLSVSDIVKMSIKNIKSQPNKTLQATQLLQLVLIHNNGHLPSFPDFIQESKNLGIEEIAYKYQKLFKRSKDFDLTTNKFNGNYTSVDFLRQWYVTERNKSEKDYIKPTRKVKKINTVLSDIVAHNSIPEKPVTKKALISAQDEVKDFIREVEKRMKKIEIEYLELQSFIYQSKKHLERSDADGNL